MMGASALLAVAVGWLLCGWLALGIWTAFFWHNFPHIQRSPDRFYRVRRDGAVGLLAGPFALLAWFCTCGFGRHGLMWRRPNA